MFVIRPLELLNLGQINTYYEINKNKSCIITEFDLTLLEIQVKWIQFCNSVVEKKKKCSDL